MGKLITSLHTDSYEMTNSFFLFKSLYVDNICSTKGAYVFQLHKVANNIYLKQVVVDVSTRWLKHKIKELLLALPQGS